MHPNRTSASPSSATVRMQAVGSDDYGPPPSAKKGSSSSALSSSQPPVVMVAIDTVFAVVGILAVVIILLAMGTDVFERDAFEEYDAAAAAAFDEAAKARRGVLGVGAAGTTANSSSSSASAFADVDKRAHALLDGTVGRNFLLKALRKRRQVRGHRKTTQQRSLVDDARRHGKLGVLAADAKANDDRRQQHNHQHVDDNNDAAAAAAAAAASANTTNSHSIDFVADAVRRVEGIVEAKFQKELHWLEGAGDGPKGIIAANAVLWEQEPEGRRLQLFSVDEEMNVFDDEASFYMSIAQFKDVLCPNTIAEIYSKARNPRRIFAGIVDQRENNPHVSPNGIGAPTDNVVPKTFLDGTCFPWYMMSRCALDDFCPTDNIRVRHANPKEGKGPTWGRYYAMLMYQGEKYFMGIDSHSRFVPHWDAQSVLNLHLLPKGTKKAVLSHYPGAFESYYSLMTPRREMWRMVMCAAHYTAIGIIRMDSVAFPPSGFPDKQAFSAGGYVFGNAQFVHEVPFDPYLFYVFDGEEVLYSVRLWTHGFDLFTPRSNILFHHYARHNAPRFWSIGISYGDQQVLGNARVKYFMRSTNNQTNVRMVSDEWAKQHNVDREEDVYGLGKERTLEEYYRFARVDPVKWTVNGSFCDGITHARHGHKYNKDKDLGAF